MTREETGRILAVLRAVYPNFYTHATPEDAAALIALWTEMFADDDYAVINAAVKALIATDEKGFPPTIGAIKARVRQITQPEALTPQEAWALVAKAVRNGYYGAEEEYAALPDEVRRVVGSADQIRRWADVESPTLHTVVASNFQKSFAARMEQKKSYDALPASVRQMLPGATQQAQLPTGFMKMIGG